MTELAGTAQGVNCTTDVKNSAAAWIGSSNLQTGGERLLAVLRDPELLASQTLADWAGLIPLSNFCDLWSQIAAMVGERSLADEIPEPIRIHWASAVFAASSHSARIRWEIDRLQAALVDVTCPILLLKGAAFLVSDFMFARGRRFSDVDLLIPKSSLPEVENALRTHGWVSSEENALHAAYFRTWLQEIAPMWHPERKVQVDIHYTIIPPKDRMRFDPASLFERSVPLGAGPFRVLAPVDMFLHATSNLFRTGEFTFLLRDLWDMHEMLAQFSPSPGFWDELVRRAAELHLQQTCFLTLRYLLLVFETPVPADVISVTDRWRPNPIFLKIADACVRRCLFPRSLDRLDGSRNMLLTLREYWPPPRLQTVCSYLFWRKRLPEWRTGRAVTGDPGEPAGDRQNPNLLG